MNIRDDKYMWGFLGVLMGEIIATLIVVNWALQNGCLR